jgi:hypothetical protein
MFRTTQICFAALAIGTAAAGCEQYPNGFNLPGNAGGSPFEQQGAALTAAGPDLVAIGTLASTGQDDNEETAGPLESGVPGNMAGGLGSGLAYIGGNKFLGIPDRGPNASPYNPLVDDTTSYITRFHTLRLQLYKARRGSTLPLTLAPELNKTTLLWDRQPLAYGAGTTTGSVNGTPALNTRKRHYLSGRSDNFDPARLSTDSFDGRFDPEGIRLSNDGATVFMTDEYGPYVYQFERASGRRLRTFSLPVELASPVLSSQGALEISGNTVGRVSNKGMEGLAITPDGRTLVGAMQSPLIQDGGTNAAFTRLIVIDIGTGLTRQFAYPLTNLSAPGKTPKYPTISEILAINDHEFLVDERDGKGVGDNSAAVFKMIFRIDLAGAADVAGLSGEANLAYKAVAKTPFLDIVAVLGAHGIVPNDIPAKLEGLAFGPDVVIAGVAKHTLFVSTDNDFLPTITDSLHPTGIDNPNKFFVFAVDAAALSYVPQQIDDGSDSSDDDE